MQLKTKIRILGRKWPVIVGVAVLLTAALAVLLIHTGHQEPPQPEPPASPKSKLLPNPYSADSFAYQGDYLTCVDGNSTLGIDISEWQTDVDWTQVRDAGVEFVMIRIGRRGEEKGLLFADERAQAHYEGAKAAGLKVGGYFFSQAISIEEAKQEADYALELTKDWELDMPIAFDWEHLSDSNRTAQVDGETLTACAAAFCSQLRQAGQDTLIYFNWDFANSRLDLEKLSNCGFWFAMYGEELDFDHRVDMWQYTQWGQVPGIEGDVDLNLLLTYEGEGA